MSQHWRQVVNDHYSGWGDQQLVDDLFTFFCTNGRTKRQWKQLAKESEEQVVKEEKVESAGPGVQEHQESQEHSPAAPVGEEEIEEVGGARKDEEMPACKQEDNEEAVPEVGAPVRHVKEEPLPND